MTVLLKELNFWSDEDSGGVKNTKLLKNTAFLAVFLIMSDKKLFRRSFFFANSVSINYFIAYFHQTF